MRRGVTVSSTLLFSPPELQDQFHAWMAEIPAVWWHPRLVLELEFLMPFWLLGRDECGWIYILPYIPMTLLVGARVAMEAKGWSKQVQSLVSLLAMAYFLVLVNTLMAVKDTCHISIGPGGTSLAATVAFAEAAIIADHAITPCTVQHAPVLSVVIGIGDCSLVYVRYLQLNGGLAWDESDPYLLKLLAVCFTSVVSSLAVYCARVYLSRGLMIRFLRSLPHND